MTATFRRLTLLLALSMSLPSAFAQQKLKAPKQDKDEIYEAVAKPAVPVGGVEAYGKYLADNQQYPTAALRAGKQGTVPVTFVVEKNGGISNVAVVTPVDPALDAEAVRLIKGGPKWTPAEHKGGKVRQRVTVPISFEIPKEAGSTATAAPSATGDAPVTQTVAPDEPARPVGGTDAFFAWIQDHMKYPPMARQKKIEGRVTMEFIVQKDGSLTDIKALNKLGGGCEEEAVRLIKAAPKWTPARYKGQPMKQKMVLPVLFQL
ncbi:energy transducer TonB [Hymenobacter sp. BT175]|uniref:energy transducer TonB n=1 Tax=Hymenobacter translucens TaxID=2886507 RepID=UPI001D0F4337|nr:energy transducer TonB [Hymenobacter translucens]MCC2548389.1 energy transducer TonB [Hymenobacter translucens]